jgi:biotin operon repressor
MNGTARGSKTITDEELLELFEEAEDAFLTASGIAETVGMSRQGVSWRLRDLEENGRLARKQCGSGYGYWLVH